MAINEYDSVKTARDALNLVYDALQEKGYDPVAQLTGYILFEDPAYITPNRKARMIIGKFDRDDYLAELMNTYFAGR